MRPVHLALVLLPLVVACKKEDLASGAAYKEHDAPITERMTEEGLVRVDVDVNEDTRADIYNYYRERTDDRLLVRKEIDLNMDGEVDVKSYFNDEGELEREEMDSDFNGTFDWIDHYQGGKRVMTEVDTTGDGQKDVFSYFDEGRITRKERDTTGDGNIDFWERYSEEGEVLKTGADIDGDGKIDVREE